MEHAAKVQLQIRHNAMEMQEYLRDLGDWEESVKRRDGELRRGRARSAAREPRSLVRARAGGRDGPDSAALTSTLA